MIKRGINAGKMLTKKRNPTKPIGMLRERAYDLKECEMSIEMGKQWREGIKGKGGGAST